MTNLQRLLRGLWPLSSLLVLTTRIFVVIQSSNANPISFQSQESPSAGSGNVLLYSLTEYGDPSASYGLNMEEEKSNQTTSDKLNIDARQDSQIEQILSTAPTAITSNADSQDSNNYNGTEYVVPPYMQHMTTVLVTLHVSVFISGLIGNALVCLSVYRNKSLQTVTNYYIVNLAVADFLVILICLPPTVYWDLYLTWNFGLVLCKGVLYLQSISVSVSVLTLTCISIDRWYAICRPLEFSSTKYRAKVTIALIWLVSMLIASPDVIFLTTRRLYEENDFVYTDCTYNWPEENTKMYQLCLLILLFLFPFLLMSISYSHIVNVLWRNEALAESLQESYQLEEEQQQYQAMKLKQQQQQQLELESELELELDSNGQLKASQSNNIDSSQLTRVTKRGGKMLASQLIFNESGGCGNKQNTNTDTKVNTSSNTNATQSIATDPNASFKTKRRRLKLAAKRGVSLDGRLVIGRSLASIVGCQRKTPNWCQDCQQPAKLNPIEEISPRQSQMPLALSSVKVNDSATVNIARDGRGSGVVVNCFASSDNITTTTTNNITLPALEDPTGSREAQEDAQGDRNIDTNTVPVNYNHGDRPNNGIESIDCCFQMTGFDGSGGDPGDCSGGSGRGRERDSSGIKSEQTKGAHKTEEVAACEDRKSSVAAQQCRVELKSQMKGLAGSFDSISLGKMASGGDENQLLGLEAANVMEGKMRRLVVEAGPAAATPREAPLQRGPCGPEIEGERAESGIVRSNGSSLAAAATVAPATRGSCGRVDMRNEHVETDDGQQVANAAAKMPMEMATCALPEVERHDRDAAHQGQLSGAAGKKVSEVSAWRRQCFYCYSLLFGGGGAPIGGCCCSLFSSRDNEFANRPKSGSRKLRCGRGGGKTKIGLDEEARGSLTCDGEIVVSHAASCWSCRCLCPSKLTSSSQRRKGKQRSGSTINRNSPTARVKATGASQLTLAANNSASKSNDSDNRLTTAASATTKRANGKQSPSSFDYPRPSNRKQRVAGGCYHSPANNTTATTRTTTLTATSSSGYGSVTGGPIPAIATTTSGSLAYGGEELEEEQSPISTKHKAPTMSHNYNYTAMAMVGGANRGNAVSSGDDRGIRLDDVEVAPPRSSTSFRNRLKSYKKFRLGHFASARSARSPSGPGTSFAATTSHSATITAATTAPASDGQNGQSRKYVPTHARFCKLVESRKKAAKMLIVIVIMFGLCYLPIHFLNLLRVTIGLPQNNATTIASLVSHWLCYFNSAVNPLIYNLMSGKFRHEFANLFFCRWFRRSTISNMSHG